MFHSTSYCNLKQFYNECVTYYDLCIIGICQDVRYNASTYLLMRHCKQRLRLPSCTTCSSSVQERKREIGCQVDDIRKRIHAYAHGYVHAYKCANRHT